MGRRVDNASVRVFALLATFLLVNLLPRFSSPLHGYA